MSIRFVLLLFIMSTSHNYGKQKTRQTLILDPAGDMHNAGRQIHDQYERTIAFQCAQVLKKELEQKASNLLILFTRLPGQTIDPYEKIQFINQLSADLVISLHFYETTHVKAQFHIYYYAHQDTPTASRALRCTPFDKAHIINKEHTHYAAQYIIKKLSEPTFLRQCDVHPPMSIPCKPCKGTISPALCIELGITKAHHDLNFFIQPLSQTIYELCLELKKQ